MVKNIINKNAPEEQYCNIAIKRQKRQIKAQVKCGYANLIDFALNVVNSLNNHEPCSYKEVISYKESY